MDEVSVTITHDERRERRKQVVWSLRDKSYRHELVQQQIEMGIPFQIRAMRLARDMNQGEVGTLLGKPQSVVSRMENPGYGAFTLKTLREVAQAFDVALLVAFVPFSSLADRIAGFSVEDLDVPSYGKDQGLEGSVSVGNVVYLTKKTTLGNTGQLRISDTSPDHENNYETYQTSAV